MVCINWEYVSSFQGSLCTPLSLSLSISLSVDVVTESVEDGPI